MGCLEMTEVHRLIFMISLLVAIPLGIPLFINAEKYRVTPDNCYLPLFSYRCGRKEIGA